MRMTDTVRKSRRLHRAVIWSDKVLTKLAYIVYPVFAVMLFIKKDPDAVRAVIVPAVSFILLSVFRWALNAPRPYEIFGADPVIKKDTKGKSFPSRHVFSMFVIAVTVLYFSPVPGIILVAAGVLMAAARVAGGVHFPADVIAGAVAGAGCGFIGFWLIP